MKKNIGSIDKWFRIIIAGVAAGLYFTGTVTGTTAIILGVVGIIMLATSLVGTCPLYLPFGLSTKKKNS